MKSVRGSFSFPSSFCSSFFGWGIQKRGKDPSLLRDGWGKDGALLTGHAFLHLRKCISNRILP